jgi:hypothetical protein
MKKNFKAAGSFLLVAFFWGAIISVLGDNR